MEKKQKTHLKIAKIHDLPTLPEASCKIITAVNDPDISIEELTRVISASSALTGRLLGLANSAYFGRPGKIEDLRLAIIQVLGLNLVKGLALSILLSNQLDVSACPNFNGEKFWGHGLLTAILAQRLGLLMNDEKVSPSAAYTGGLLLNIGLLAVVYIFPKELNQVFISIEENDSSLTDELFEVLGTNHYEIGHLLLKRWRLPKMFPLVLQHYGQESSQHQEAEIKTMINLLLVSSHLSRQIYLEEVEELSIPVNEIKQLGLVPAKAQRIVDGLIENRENIRDMAISMTGK